MRRFRPRPAKKGGGGRRMDFEEQKEKEELSRTKADAFSVILGGGR
jgi:hypothetical protein